MCAVLNWQIFETTLHNIKSVSISDGLKDLDDRQQVM